MINPSKGISNDFNQRNFTFTSYVDNQGKYHHLYELTRDKFFIRVWDTKIWNHSKKLYIKLYIETEAKIKIQHSIRIEFYC